MAYDGYSKQSLTSIASKPSERESCRICKKFVYFHQPILLCFAVLILSTLLLYK